MPDVNIGAAARRYGSGVVFQMRTSAGFVWVRIANEALNSLEDKPEMHPDYADYIAIFDRNRDAVESVARWKRDHNLAESDGSILLTSYDLQG